MKLGRPDGHAEKWDIWGPTGTNTQKKGTGHACNHPLILLQHTNHEGLCHVTGRKLHTKQLLGWSDDSSHIHLWGPHWAERMAPPHAPGLPTEWTGEDQQMAKKNKGDPNYSAQGFRGRGRSVKNEHRETVASMTIVMGQMEPRAPQGIQKTPIKLEMHKNDRI